MTFLGKLLVLVNLVLSTIMCFWAVVLYTNSVDWSNAPAKGDQPAGLLNQRKARITELQGVLPGADRSWRVARSELLEREGGRQADRDWYTQELQHVLSGATA